MHFQKKFSTILTKEQKHDSKNLKNQLDDILEYSFSLNPSKTQIIILFELILEDENLTNTNLDKLKPQVFYYSLFHSLKQVKYLNFFNIF